MDAQILDTPPTLTRKLRFAGFWIRFVAVIIDSIIVSGINFMLASSFYKCSSKPVVSIVTQLTSPMEIVE